MKIGMLYFDNSKKDIIEKINAAVDYYFQKYALVADLVFVHPSMIPEEIFVGKIQIRRSKSILPNHFWIGQNREDT